MVREQTDRAAGQGLNPALAVWTGNVTHVEYERFQAEMMRHFLEKFSPMGFTKAIVHLDGARSHKRLDDRAPTKNDSMSVMRAWLRAHKAEAEVAGFVEAMWDERAPGTNRGKLSKDALWTMTAAVKEKVPRKYVSVTKGRRGDVGGLALSPEAARVSRGAPFGAHFVLMFTPPCVRQTNSQMQTEHTR